MTKVCGGPANSSSASRSRTSRGVAAPKATSIPSHAVRRHRRRSGNRCTPQMDGWFAGVFKQRTGKFDFRAAWAPEADRQAAFAGIMPVLRAYSKCRRRPRPDALPRAASGRRHGWSRGAGWCSHRCPRLRGPRLEDIAKTISALDRVQLARSHTIPEEDSAKLSATTHWHSAAPMAIGACSRELPQPKFLPAITIGYSVSICPSFTKRTGWASSGRPHRSKASELRIPR